jgi:chemotaxis protein MotA
MIVIVGAMLVLGAVLLGFSMAGGKVGALVHLSEFVTIGGASTGALVIMTPKKVLVDLIRGIIQALKGSAFSKATALDVFKLLYGLGKVTRQDGILSLESHIGSPEQSALFQESPRVLKNPHLLHFLCDGLYMIVDSKGEGAQLQGWLEEEIKVVEREHHAASTALTKTADALPGFGIVAAVLGIVVTMQSIGGPVEEIGHKVGAALVGTFLGILLAYGFFAPMAGRLESLGEQEAVFLRAVSAAIVAINDGASPRDVVNRARRVLGNDCRPTHAEMKAITG